LSVQIVRKWKTFRHSRMLVGGRFLKYLASVGFSNNADHRKNCLHLLGFFFQSIGAFKSAFDRLENNVSGEFVTYMPEKMLSYRNIISGASKPVVIQDRSKLSRYMDL